MPRHCSALVWHISAPRATHSAALSVCLAVTRFPWRRSVPPDAPASRILRAGHPHRVTRGSIARDHTKIEDIMQLMTLTRRLRLPPLSFTLMYPTSLPPTPPLPPPP